MLGRGNVQTKKLPCGETTQEKKIVGISNRYPILPGIVLLSNVTGLLKISWFG